MHIILKQLTTEVMCRRSQYQQLCDSGGGGRGQSLHLPLQIRGRDPHQMCGLGLGRGLSWGGVVQHPGQQHVERRLHIIIVITRLMAVVTMWRAGGVSALLTAAPQCPRSSVSTSWGCTCVGTPALTWASPAPVAMLPWHTLTMNTTAACLQRSIASGM